VDCLRPDGAEASLVVTGGNQELVRGDQTLVALVVRARQIACDPPGPPGGGHVEREYGIGRGRIDLLVRWPYPDTTGKRAWQRQAIELKVWRDNESDPLTKGLTQLDGYLDRLRLDTGILVIFERRPNAAPIAERTRFDQATSPTGRPVTILRA